MREFEVKLEIMEKETATLEEKVGEVEKEK